jgi:hypothetical protein
MKLAFQCPLNHFKPLVSFLLKRSITQNEAISFCSKTSEYLENVHPTYRKVDGLLIPCFPQKFVHSSKVGVGYPMLINGLLDPNFQKGDDDGSDNVE